MASVLPVIQSEAKDRRAKRMSAEPTPRINTDRSGPLRDAAARIGFAGGSFGRCAPSG